MNTWYPRVNKVLGNGTRERASRRAWNLVRISIFRNSVRFAKRDWISWFRPTYSAEVAFGRLKVNCRIRVSALPNLLDISTCFFNYFNWTIVTFEIIFHPRLAVFIFKWNKLFFLQTKHQQHSNFTINHLSNKFDENCKNQRKVSKTNDEPIIPTSSLSCKSESCPSTRWSVSKIGEILDTCSASGSQAINASTILLSVEKDSI